MADKKLGEYIRVEMAKGIKPVKIERKGMSDAEWERVRKSAVDAGTLVDEEGNKVRAGVWESSFAKDKTIFDKSEPEAAPAAAPVDTRPSFEDQKRIDGLKKKVDKSVIEADKKANPDLEELELQTNAGGGGSTPMARAAAMAQGAVMGATPGVPTLPMRFGNDPVSRAAASEGPPAPPGLFSPMPPGDVNIDGTDPRDNLITKGVAAVDRILTPSPSAGPALADPVDEKFAAKAAAEKAAQGGAQEQGGGGGGGSGSASLSMKKTTPGAGGLPAQADPYADERARMLKAADGAKEAHTKLAEVEASRAAAESKILNDKINFTAENEKKRIAAVSAYEETLAKGQQTMNAIADERRALMNQKVDPDAYFTKGGVGRAITAHISAALFGWAGQGPQFLQRLDNLAQQEVKNQQDELARKSGELSLIAADKKNVIAMAQEAGMTQVQSLAAARVSFFESVKDQLAKVAVDNPTLAAQAQLEMAKIDQHLAGDLMALQQATQTAAHQNVQDRIAMMNAQTNRMELGVKMAAASMKGGGKPLPEAGVKLLDGYTESLQQIQQMRELAKNGGWQDRAGQKMAQEFPLGYAEEKGKGKQFGALKVGWMTGKARGALQSHEVALLDPLIGERGQVSSDPVPNLEIAERLALEQLDRAIASHRANGWDTTGYEQARDKLAAKIGRSSVPGEKPYGER